MKLPEAVPLTEDPNLDRSILQALKLLIVEIRKLQLVVKDLQDIVRETFHGKGD